MVTTSSGSGSGEEWVIEWVLVIHLFGFIRSIPIYCALWYFLSYSASPTRTAHAKCSRTAESAESAESAQ